MTQTEYETLEAFTELGYSNAGAAYQDVYLLTLSACKYCHEAKQFLEGLGIPYKSLDIDTASKEERDKAMMLLGEKLPAKGVELAFPLVIIGREIIIGFDEEEIMKTLKQIDAF